MKSVALIPIFLVLLAGPSRGQGVVDNACADTTQQDNSNDLREARRADLERQRQARLAEQARQESAYQAANDDYAARHPRLADATASAALKWKIARSQVDADMQHIGENSSFSEFGALPRDEAKDEKLHANLVRDEQALSQAYDEFQALRSKGQQASAPVAASPAAKPVPAAAAPVAQLGPAPAPPSQQSAAPNPPAAPTPAQQAGCHTDNFNCSAVLSDKVSTKAVSTGGAPCLVKVAPQHPDLVQFTSGSIEKQPSSGSFTQEGPFAFKYQPTPGFKGSDQYGIKVCGHNSQRAGCATITFNVTVQ
jgi:hypothetical protein